MYKAIQIDNDLVLEMENNLVCGFKNFLQVGAELSPSDLALLSDIEETLTNMDILLILSEGLVF